MTKQSLQVSLSPSGGLQVALPGAGGAERIVELRHTTTCDPADTLRRILSDMAYGKVSLGEDGNPTRAQVQHWERHRTFPDRRCVFCQAESAKATGVRPHPSDHRFDARYAARPLADGVVVRRVPQGASGANDKKAAVRQAEVAAKRNFAVKARNARELGF